VFGGQKRGHLPHNWNFFFLFSFWTDFAAVPIGRQGFTQAGPVSSRPICRLSDRRWKRMDYFFIIPNSSSRRAIAP